MKNYPFKMENYKIDKWYRGLGYYIGTRLTHYPGGNIINHHLFKKGADKDGVAIINKLPI